MTRGIQVDSLLEDQRIKTAGNGKERWMIYDVYSEDAGTGFWVRGMISMTEYGQAFGNLPLLAALAAFGGYRITKRAFQPVKQIAETAEAIGSGNDLSQRIKTDGKGDELNRLGDVMNEMLARLQASFESERRFSSDVSHELRTPIAVIRSQCEFALSGQAGEEEQKEAFEAVLKQSERMHSIVSQLLLLSRAENGTFEPVREPVEFHVLCETVCEELGQIFNRFYRADHSRSSEGTGLGLSMAEWIARVHGGSIQAESIYGKGSIFTVKLPIER